jgi:hypothetical protein
MERPLNTRITTLPGLILALSQFQGIQALRLLPRHTPASKLNYSIKLCSVNMLQCNKCSKCTSSNSNSNTRVCYSG